MVAMMILPFFLLCLFPILSRQYVSSFLVRSPVSYQSAHISLLLFSSSCSCSSDYPSFLLLLLLLL